MATVVWDVDPGWIVRWTSGLCWKGWMPQSTDLVAPATFVPKAPDVKAAPKDAGTGTAGNTGSVSGGNAGTGTGGNAGNSAVGGNAGNSAVGGNVGNSGSGGNTGTGTGGTSKSLTVTGTAGTYTISVGGVASAAIQHDGDANAIKAAIEGIAAVGSGKVTVTGTGPFVIALDPTVAGAVTVTGAGLTGGTATLA